MKLLRRVFEEFVHVNYFGMVIAVPSEAKWLAVQPDGYLCAFFGAHDASDIPELLSGSWHDAAYVEGRQGEYIAKVDLEGTDPARTLKKVSELVQVNAEDIAVDFSHVIFDVSKDLRIPGLKDALRIFNGLADPQLMGYEIELLVDELERK